jgi:hypothetical protein
VGPAATFKILLPGLATPRLVPSALAEARRSAREVAEASLTPLPGSEPQAAGATIELEVVAAAPAEMMELAKPARKRASAADRYGGPACIFAFSGVVTALSQVGVFAATGYSREGEHAKLVSTRETAELLWVLAIVQLCALGLAWLFLAMTNMLDPGAVELNTLSSMVDMASEGAEQRSRTGRLLKSLPSGEEIEFRWCWHCHIWRPPMANHCPTCHRCFLGLDHHCPWTGERSSAPPLARCAVQHARSLARSLTRARATASQGTASRRTTSASSGR